MERKQIIMAVLLASYCLIQYYLHQEFAQPEWNHSRTNIPDVDRNHAWFVEHLLDFNSAIGVYCTFGMSSSLADHE